MFKQRATGAVRCAILRHRYLSITLGLLVWVRDVHRAVLGPYVDQHLIEIPPALPVFTEPAAKHNTMSFVFSQTYKDRI